MDSQQSLVRAQRGHQVFPRLGPARYLRDVTRDHRVARRTGRGAFPGTVAVVMVMDGQVVPGAVDVPAAVSRFPGPGPVPDSSR